MNDLAAQDLTGSAQVRCGLEPCPLTSQDEITAQGWRFLACRRCGQMRIPEDCLIHHRVDPDPVAELSKPMRMLFRMRMEWLTRAVPRYDDKQAAWMDAGCGDGQFLDYLKSIGYKRAVGVEPDAVRAENARRRGIAVYESPEEVRAATGLERFDLITLWHVVEHVPQPADLLRDYGSLLAPGGALVFQVPNHASAQTRIFGRWSAFPDYGRHVWFHTPTLVDWTKDALPGYFVERLRDFNFEYEIFGWVDSVASAVTSQQNFVHRTLKKEQASPREKLAGAAGAAVLLPIAVAGSALSLALGRGSTLTIMARRPNEPSSADVG